MSKRKQMRPNVSMEEFLAGEELVYSGADWRKTQATYRPGVGIYVERDGKDLGLAGVVDDAGARHAYVNLTRRRRQSAEEVEEEIAS